MPWKIKFLVPEKKLFSFPSTKFYIYGKAAKKKNIYGYNNRLSNTVQVSRASEV